MSSVDDVIPNAVRNLLPGMHAGRSHSERRKRDPTQSHAQATACVFREQSTLHARTTASVSRKRFEPPDSTIQRIRKRFHPENVPPRSARDVPVRRSKSVTTARNRFQNQLSPEFHEKELGMQSVFTDPMHGPSVAVMTRWDGFNKHTSRVVCRSLSA